MPKKKNPRKIQEEPSGGHVIAPTTPAPENSAENSA
jgi:hypothetical protein